MSRKMSRAEQGIQIIANEILNESYQFEVSPYRVMDEVRKVVNNKMACVRAANPENAEELMEMIRRQMTTVTPTKYEVHALGQWGTFVEPQRIVYSGNRTIVFWNDGTKTIVKLREGDEFDEYLGFIAAYAKKMFGSTSKLKKFIKTVSHYNKPKEPKKAKKSDETEN